MRIGFWRATLQLGGLWALAFAQPLFGLLGDQAGFFVARGSAPLDIVILALGYGLVPPLAGGALVWAAGRLRPVAGLGAHAALIALLVAALALPPAGDALDGSAGAVPVALAAGALAAALYVRAEGVRALLTALAPAPAIVIGLFLLASPASELLTADEAAGSAAGPERSSVPIVHVVFDELPVTTVTDEHGRLDARRFPNLASLARDGTWYRHATTAADVTLEAVPLQATGRLPRAGMLPTPADHPHSLFTLFARSHDVIAVEPITDVCPRRLCAEERGALGERLSALAGDVRVVAGHLLLPADLREGLPSIDDTWGGFGADPEPLGPDEQAERRDQLGKAVAVDLKRADAAAGFAHVIARLRRPRQRPPLVFMHSILPHAPWRFLPDGRRYAVPGTDPIGLEAKRWLGWQGPADQGFQRHVLQARYADALLGRLLAELRRSGLYDRAVIVVTSDHGASFRASMRRRMLTPENLPDVAGVPFVVKLPGQEEGAVDGGAVRTTDVLPTIAKAAGVRVPWEIDGRPADERPEDPGATIAVARSGGPGESAPLGELLAWQRRRNAREAWLLRHGDYGVGPRPDLIGRRAPQRLPARPRATVRLPGPLVAGGTRGVGMDAVLAVAVDGRVAATTRAYPEASGFEYRALIPPRRHPGAVTVLEVLPGDRLRPLGGTPR